MEQPDSRRSRCTITDLVQELLTEMPNSSDGLFHVLAIL